MREEDRIPRNHQNEETVAQLLTHLQQMRRSVPVNYHLKAELKKQLLQRMKELDTTKRQPDFASADGKGKWLLRLGIGALVLALVVIGFSWWQKDALSVSERILLTLPKKSSVEQVDMDAAGTRLAYIVNQTEIRTLALSDKIDPVLVKLPPTTGGYLALSWANHGKRLAVVEEQGQQSRIWIVDLPDQNRPGSSRLLKEEDGVHYHSPSWSPNDETVAYTRWKNGVEEIWVSSSVSFQEWKLAEGSQPEWSQDGRYLAFTKAGNVQVMEIRTGLVTVLGKGIWPSWSSADQLTYMARAGNLVEVSLTLQTPVSRDLTIHPLTADKLVRASWSADGTRLLLTHREEQQEVLVISLASR